MKLYRVIDKQGYFIRDDFTFNEETEIGLDVEPAQGFYKPKYNFETLLWIEGATEIPPQQPQEPTLEERVQALEQLELERMFGL